MTGGCRNIKAPGTTGTTRFLWNERKRRDHKNERKDPPCFNIMASAEFYVDNS